MTVTCANRRQAERRVKRRVVPSRVVVDVGPGIRPQSYFTPSIHVCIEPHAPYLSRLAAETRDTARFVFLNTTWDVALPLIPSGSVDSVFALDVIEHMDKEAGLAFLREAERVAREQVVVHTPLGFYPQDYEGPGAPDRWGMDGGCWQAHRSGWEPEDFGPGWDFVCCEAFHFVDQHDRPLERPTGALWAFRNVGPESQRRRLEQPGPFETATETARGALRGLRDLFRRRRRGGRHAGQPHE